MAYTLTTEQADEVVHALGFDAEDHDLIGTETSAAGTAHHYFLTDGTVLVINTANGRIQHQELNDALEPVDMDDVHAVELGLGVVEYYKNQQRIITMHF